MLEGLSVICKCRLRPEARGLASPRYTYCRLLSSRISVPKSTPDAAPSKRRDTARQPVRISHTAVQSARGRLAPSRIHLVHEAGQVSCHTSVAPFIPTSKPGRQGRISALHQVLLHRSSLPSTTAVHALEFDLCFFLNSI